MLSSEVIAGLTGAALGSFATLVTPWVTERIRRKVDRQHREEFFSARFIRRMEEAASGLILVSRDALRSAETAGTAVVAGEQVTFDILQVDNSDRHWEASLLSGYLHDERPEYAEWQLFEAWKRFRTDLYEFKGWLQHAHTQLAIAVDRAATRNTLRDELSERLARLRHSRDDMKRLVHDAVLAIGGEPFGAPYHPSNGESSAGQTSPAS
ncbi:hypothetical protein AB0J86_31845 [Micromonospora sp. NPDC049559]|uniref:hypothetical protein n=1 Tax=Micromonospora sp. NPDC049559 TaxID=3155923 RepID=UPI0034130B52